MDICFIPVDCTTEEFELFQEAANKRGMTTAQWLVSVGKANALTATVVKQQPITVSPTKTMEVAFEKLDQMDAETGMASDTKNIVEQVNEIKNLTNINTHPCNYLAHDVYPPNFKANMCSGTCLAEGFGNKPCFFNSSSANQCRLFVPRKRPSFFG